MTRDRDRSGPPRTRTSDAGEQPLADEPTRRRFLRASGVAVVASLAGCTSDLGDELPPNTKRPTARYVPDLPVTQRSSILAERIRTTADAGIKAPEELAPSLEEYSLTVESVGRERDVLTLEYITTERYRQGTAHDVGLVAGAYASLVDAGTDAVAMDVTILDDAPDSFGAAAVHTGWAERFNAGELTAEEYGELVGTTIETKRKSPDVVVEPSE